MAKLDTQPYRGMRDFYPEDARIQRYIFQTWARVAESFGYEQYEAPMLEPTELYRAKTGEEIVNEQSYTFKDRGDREVTIRPEMTPSVARMVAARQQELAYPLRWYAIGNRLRYERPQRGRLREFWQLDLDMFGVEGTEADVEIIRLAEAMMRAFGAQDNMFSIRINSRKLLSLLLGDYLQLDVEKSHRLTKLLDRKDKMNEQAFDIQAKAITPDLEKLKGLLAIKKLEDLPANVVESGLVEELRTLFGQLESYGIKNTKFDLTLMRGLDYYTGTVFELFDENPENRRSIFGGGRYDGLTSIFGKPSLPAVGFAWGDVGMYNFLETHNLLPAFPSSTDAYVVVIGNYQKQAQALANELRQAGAKVAVDVTGRKVDAQIKTATKQEIRFAIFVGEAEVKAKKYTLKDLTSEKEQKLATGELAKQLKR